jgi:hypothetical protein
MKANILLPLLAASLAGCVGLEITPLSPAEEAASHAGGTSLKGYIIYEPMVVVEVSQKEVCSAQDPKGNCTGASVISCSAGTPFVLPDTSKPFLVNVKSGFGKTAVEVAITNGWQLGNIKDNSDNTALLGTLEKIIALGAKSIAREGAVGQCKASGLYRVNQAPTGVTLSPLLIY